jgi:TolB-like protein/DNA-binding winged helix-turn-helix (wHTH) protein
MNLRNGFTLGQWDVYPLEGRIVGEGREQRLQPKSVDVLMFLAENAGTVVEREQLLRHVWGESAPSDEPLTRCIGELRRVFGDTRSRPDYFQTIPKRGYQLLKAVKPVETTSDNDNLLRDPRSIGLRLKPMLTRSVWSAAAVVSLLAIIFIGVFSGQAPLPVHGDSTAVSTDRSIAVLPFVNLSSDQEQEYFCDGISDELINMLVKSPELRVVSRTSAFSYRGKDIDIPTMARQMNVVYVLEGSVRKAGELMRISAQLVDSRSDSQLWSETYEKTFDDIFTMQDEIASRLAERTKMTLLGNAPMVEGISQETFALVL